MGDYEHLRAELAGDGVATVWLSRPPVNAVNLAMYRELRDLFAGIDQLGPGVRVVVLTGEGRHFCAGNDLDDFETMDACNVRERMFHVREAFFAIERCAVPVIGAVAGVALGTGLAIAASCDFVVAADDARFGLPELSVGVMGGARHLARLVAQPIVRWMFFTGQQLTGSEMAALGAVIKTVPRDSLLAVAYAEARRVAALSPTAMRLGKRGLNDIEFLDIHRGYELEQGLTGEMMGCADSKIALAASRRGETPVYEDVIPATPATSSPS
jgi:enoyl-CoA hydratase